LREFGLRVRSLRAAADLSQEELGFRAGMHPTYVSGIERGQRNVSLLNISMRSRPRSRSPSRGYYRTPRAVSASP
jgi:DNA-binding XRE family transcriptional regulator